MIELDPRRFEFVYFDLFEQKQLVDASEFQQTKRLWYLENICDQMEWKARPYID